MSLLAVRGAASRRGAGPSWCGAAPLSSYWGTNMTQGPAQRPVRVLVVDDHADVRFLLRAILEDAAPAVVFAGEASGAEEALAALAALEPDVVVLDARMPRVDGFEAAEMLLARRPDLPILLCSALVDDDIRSRAEEERAVARIAAGQQGMVTVEQLRAAGFGPNAISRRADGGWLAHRRCGGRRGLAGAQAGRRGRRLRIPRDACCVRARSPPRRPLESRERPFLVRRNDLGFDAHPARGVNLA